MLEVGRYTYSSSTIDYSRVFTAVMYSDEVDVKIGKFCSFADSVTIFAGGEHRTNWLTCYPLAKNLDIPCAVEHHTSKGPVTVGNDVWFGSQAFVLSGVTIGDGAVIGARSVVTKDVPAYTIVAGNPARIIRQRFNDSVIAQLLEIKWWDWPVEKIKEAAPLLQSPDMSAFLEYCCAPDVVQPLGDAVNIPHKPENDATKPRKRA